MRVRSFTGPFPHRPAALCLLAALVIAAFVFAAAELSVRRSGDQIRMVAPRMRLLEGRTLNRLQNGMTVAFDFQLSVLGEGKRTLLRRGPARFVMSYDLWEEKFSVSRVSSPARSISHLSAEAAEAWCVDQLSFPASEVGQRTVSLRLEVRAEDLERQPRETTETGLTLSDLIEVFSRTGRSPQQKWSFESGPFRIADLKAGSG